MTYTFKKKNGNCYCIKVKGLLDDKWADWFDGLTITPIENYETMLIGQVVDQAALHGILAKIRDLGLTLLTVQLCDEQVSINGGESHACR
jgi:hypothetical protein